MRVSSIWKRLLDNVKLVDWWFMHADGFLLLVDEVNKWEHSCWTGLHGTNIRFTQFDVRRDESNRLSTR